MNYRVIIQPTAQAEIERAYRWIRRQSPGRAGRWYNGLQEVIHSLKAHPERCALAPETEAFEEEIRQLLYGKRGGIYRILFTIHEDTVSVLYVRHGARMFLKPDEASDENDE